MNKFYLATDSACDYYKSALRNADIGCLKLAYIDGEETKLDEFDSDEEYLNFYEAEKEGKYYKTAGINLFDTEELFAKILKERACDIVYVCLSSGLSGSYNTALSVATRLNEKSKHKIYVVDSKFATIGQKMILDKAIKLRDDGVSAADAVKALEADIKRVGLRFFVSDFEHLKKSGRLSALTAMIGKLIQLRLIITFSEDGSLKLVDKCIGTKKAIKILIDKALADYDTTSDSPIYLSLTADTQANEELTNEVKKSFANVKIVPTYIGPVIGSHTGPSAVGFCYAKM